MGTLIGVGGRVADVLDKALVAVSDVVDVRVELIQGFLQLEMARNINLVTRDKVRGSPLNGLLTSDRHLEETGLLISLDSLEIGQAFVCTSHENQLLHFIQHQQLADLFLILECGQEARVRQL